LGPICGLAVLYQQQEHWHALHRLLACFGLEMSSCPLPCTFTVS
jgi:hypothetical protein